MSSSIGCCARSGGDAPPAKLLAVTIVTGLTLALIGLGAILTASTLAWMISVRLEDASIADICWGLGFVLLAWLYCLLSPTLRPRSWPPTTRRAGGSR